VRVNCRKIRGILPSYAVAAAVLFQAQLLGNRSRDGTLEEALLLRVCSMAAAVNVNSRKSCSREKGDKSNFTESSSEVGNDGVVPEY